MGGGTERDLSVGKFRTGGENCRRAGALISEFSMTVQPDRQTFPMRNRIISGASYGVLVVEAGSKSGALHSATFAAEQGRSVFAVPGPIDRPGCQGSNRLNPAGCEADHGCGRHPGRPPRPVCAGRPSPRPPDPVPTPENLTAEERRVFESIGDRGNPHRCHHSQSGLPTGTVSSTLFALELKRAVKQLPGKNFVRLS